MTTPRNAVMPSVFQLQQRLEQSTNQEDFAEMLAEQINGECYPAPVASLRNATVKSTVQAWQNVAVILAAEIERLTSGEGTLASDAINEAIYG